MSFTMEGKYALVTGANRGIGKGFVEVLLAQGASKIYAAARDLDNLQELVELNPAVITPIQLDVTDANQIQALESSIDSLDILINNAGIASATYTTGENAIEVARKEMEVNLFGAMAVTQALLPKLKASNEAAIINIASIAAISNFPSLGPYSATKAALHSYTQGLRADLSNSNASLSNTTLSKTSSTNIRVVGVYPGPIDTRLAEGMEMDKPSPDQVAIKTFEGLKNQVNDIFPDDFSHQMYSAFLKHPNQLEQAFSEMTAV